MSAITVKFERDVSNTHTFENVVNVEWSNEYVRDFLVDQTSQIGHKITTFNINGFVQQHGDPSDNVVQQQVLEDSLRAIGTGTLSYTGATDIPDVRFLALDFKEYRGSTIAQFTARFVTETQNVQAHAPVTIGAQALTIAEGFEPPQVEDSIASQGPDEQMNNLRRRKIRINGRMVGTLSQVNTAQANLIAAIENINTIVVDISTASGGVLLTIRPGSITFGSPEQRGNQSSRTYNFEGVTHDDYSKEPYTIGHQQLTFGGILLDEVHGIDHAIEGEHEVGAYTVISEKATISGKKYFLGWTQYDAFVQSFQPLPINTHFYGAPNTYQTLELRDISISNLERDGNFVGSPHDKRYSATVTLNFVWFKNITQTHQNYLTTLLAIPWFKVSTTTHSFSLDTLGNVTSRSVTLSGQLFDADLATAKGLIGTAVVLGDPAIPGSGGASYYITSVNINNTDTITTQPGNTVIKLHDVSVTASQLDTATQKTFFLISIFKLDTTRQMTFDRVTSQSKSLSTRWVTDLQKFKTTSVNLTISGEIWEDDLGGAPALSNRAYDFFDLFDATQEATLTPECRAPPRC